MANTINNIVNKINAMANNVHGFYTVHLHQEIGEDRMKVVLVENRFGKKRVVREVCGNGLHPMAKQEIFRVAIFHNRNEAMQFCDNIGEFFRDYCEEHTSVGVADAIMRWFA